ncbi:MAG: aldo/keto reductase [Desulfatitalea sp.]|nr:aldo/keto reductase [Desulfatitalea sp.]NNK00452.1 aldo/keto reductase [Desulfatitalea sp.]
MLYRKIPKTGDEISILGFGCMRLPMTKEGHIDEPRAIRQIRGAIDQGVNYLDTAWPYHTGESENVLGRALADGYRERVRVATKLPSWMIKTREDMDRYLDAQLEKLGTGWIDYYLLHALDGNSWENLERLGVTGFMDAALADGRIRNAGFSFHGRLADFKHIVDAYPWVFCQIQYNYLDQQFQAGTEGLEYAAQKNLGVIIMEPLRGGNLALPTPPPAVEQIWKQAETRRTPAQWALRWVWHHPAVTVVLSGMNEETHIQENIAIAEAALPASLTDAELDTVATVAAKYLELMKVGCTGCGYCLPCPEGVAIPVAFEVYNKMHLFGNEDEAKYAYAFRLSGQITGSDPGYALQCVSCGECLEKCPQHIDIPNALAEVAEQLEDDEMENRLAIAKKMMNMIDE